MLCWRHAKTALCFANEEDVEQALKFCREQFRLSQRNDKGATLREQLELLEEQLGYPPPELVEMQTELPQGFENVWIDFLKLHRTRSSGFGLNAISNLELQAYCQLNGLDLDPEEVEMIQRFDAEALDEINSQQEKDRKRQEAKSARK